MGDSGIRALENLIHLDRYNKSKGSGPWRTSFIWTGTTSRPSFIWTGTTRHRDPVPGEPHSSGQVHQVDPHLSGQVQQVTGRGGTISTLIGFQMNIF